MIKRDLNLQLAALALCVMAACASSREPTFGAMQGHLPSLQSDHGRIFFYREGRIGGSANQPEIILNGEKVGTATPGAVFFVDRPAASYSVTCGETLELELAPGHTRYVQFIVRSSAFDIGLIGALVGAVRPILVHPAQAANEIKALSYTGHAIPE